MRGSANYLGVHPDYRGRGIANALVNRLEKKLIARGYIYGGRASRDHRYLLAWSLLAMTLLLLCMSHFFSDMLIGANALDTANAVKARIAQMEKQFPAGLKAVVAFDTTPFVKLSIEEVVKTLVEAIVLVFLVM